MYYVEQENNEFVKYQVIYDEKKLRQLKYEIIRECGEIVPYKYQSTSCQVNPYDYEHITHYKEQFVKWYEPNDFYSSDEKIYEYSYEQHMDTRLSNLICRLLDGDVSAIYEIKNPVVSEKKQESLPNPEIDLKKYMEQNFRNINPNALERIKNKMVIYKRYQELNRNRKSEIDYYPLVLASIQIVEVERMSVDKIQKREAMLAQIMCLQKQADAILEEVKPFFEGTQQESVFIRDLRKN